jgi:phage regulator Rha-like protein
MGKEIVVIHKGEPRVSTWVLKDGFGFGEDHRYLVRMIEKYKPDFEDFGVVTTERQQLKGKTGRPVQAVLLNESQAMFLGALFRNSPEVIVFKKRLVKEFARMKNELVRIAAQNQNAQWLETRHAGKETRLIATDSIKAFVSYAKGQGSTKAEMYYANISKMENKALFLLEQKYTNLRDTLDIHQLSTIKSADQIVMKALKDGMDKGMHYRDIYAMAKLRVESFAEIIGKTLIPAKQIQIAED